MWGARDPISSGSPCNSLSCGHQQECPVMERPRSTACSHPTLNDFLLSPQNELDDVPFFDVRLPYELAINIFQYLNRRELGLCAQVSSCHMWPRVPENWGCVLR
jgi:hypothetical protein